MVTNGTSSTTLFRSAALALILALAVAAPAVATAAQADGGQSGDETDAKVAAEDKTGAEGADEAGKTDDESDEEKPGGKALPLQMQGAEPLFGNIRVNGRFKVGYRAVDVEGRVTKFNEDVDLDDGPRLLDSRLIFTPASPTEGRLYDRAVLEANGLGGDPYESWGFDVFKAGTYRFQLDNRTVDYFWNVTGEPHAWDLTRTSTDASLSVTAFEGLEFHASFGRWRQDRLRLTTRDLSRDEFHFDEPLDQDASYWGGGARWNIEESGTTLFFDQEFRSFNDNGGFSGGPTDGLTPGEAFVDFLEQKEVRSIDAPVGRGGIVQRALDGRVTVNADFLYSNQTLGFDFSRVWEGLNFQERSVEAEEAAFGGAERLVRHANASVAADVHPMVTVNARYRHRGFDQSGDSFSREAEFFPLQDSFSGGNARFVSEYEIEQDQITGGVEVRPDPRVTVFGEVGVTAREQLFRHFEDGELEFEEEEETDTTSFMIGGSVRPDPRFTVRATYDRGDIEDGFTRITPTTTDNIKVRVKAMAAEGVQVSGHATFRDVSNEVSEYSLESSSVGAAVTWAHGDRGWVTASFARNDLETTVPIRFIFPFFGNFVEDDAFYETQDNVFTVATDVTVSEEIPLGLFGSVTYLDSSGTVPLDWYDVRFGGRYTLPRGFFFELEGRFLEYEENTELPSAVDDYEASIFTVSVGFDFR